MSTNLDPSTTVAQAVLSHSACAPVFQHHRIDYCCQGGRSIARAAHDRGVDVDRLLGELAAAIDARGDGVELDAVAMSTPALIDHIVSTHHAYLRKTLPFVEALSAKVARVHGERDPRLVAIRDLVVALGAALSPHLDVEEQTLFPALRSAAPDRSLIAAELAAMHDDHLAVGGLLAQLRATTADYARPDWACTSYRTLFGELEHLEGDVLRHVHLENHALMPRFTTPAKELR